MNWKYIEKNEYPKTNKCLISYITEEGQKRTGYACYDAKNKYFHNNNGYIYNTYAWTKPIEPAEPLYHKDWRDFFVINKSTYDLICEYCKRNNLEIKTEIDEVSLYYAYIEILCTIPEEDKIDTLIEIWEK